MLSGGIFHENLLIYTDSLSVIKSLTNVVSKSIFVHKYREFVREITDQTKVTLMWLPGHSDIVENCIADELCRVGTDLAIYILQT